MQIILFIIAYHILSVISNIFAFQKIQNTKVMEDDQQVIKQIMNLIGSRKQIKGKLADGQFLKISIGNGSSFENVSNSEDISNDLFSQELTAPQIISLQKKKVSLNTKSKSKQANQLVLNFMSESDKLQQKFQPQKQKTRSCKQVVESLQLLRKNHPQQKNHLDLITQRMTALQKIQQEKLKLDQQISSILSSSFSHSFDPSSQMSLLSIVNTNSDPLCQIFNSYLKKTVETKKNNNQKLPSFLFLYSQPMIDQKGSQINYQINYFQEEGTIQKILKSCNINYIRQRATINKFHYWLKQNVSIMHFCGHGVKQQTNYLLFQTLTGLSVKVDTEFLNKVLHDLINPLKLVFVASCHSQSTGRIFAEAGASHVICVKDNYQILDDICQQFVKVFYHSAINDKMTICEAFAFAKKQLILTSKFKIHECQKFILLKNHNQQCTTSLNVLTENKIFNDLTPKPFYFRNLPSRVENFIPRPRDMHQILKMVDNKRRFITIVGCAGIGKSTLARQLVRYIQFRDFFRDGVIYNDIRNCQNIDKLFETLNIEMFQNTQIKLNKKSPEYMQNLLKQLFDKHVLLVLDNCQSILANSRDQFTKLIQSIMKNCVNVYFIFTHRNSIGRQLDYCSQKLYQLNKLNEQQAERLFFLRAPRSIQKKQLDQFFAIDQFKCGKHPFFEFLNGHPEAICMTASLLSQRRLSDIYDLLMKPCLTNQLQKLQYLTSNQQKQKLFKNQQINKVIETAMKISLNVLKNKHKQASEMIKTLSLLPRGLDPEMMSKLFSIRWKQNANKLLHHSLIQKVDSGSIKYYTVNPYIIMHVENEMTNQQKMKYHERICEQFHKRIQKMYKSIGTISQFSLKSQEQFLNQQINYQAIIFRQLSLCGDPARLRKMYANLFQYEDDNNQSQQDDKISIDIKSNAVQDNRKKIVYSQKILQPTKRQSMAIILVYYATILLVMKNFLECKKFIQIGIIISRKKNKLIIQANLLRLLACIYFIKNSPNARQYFYKSWELFALQGCGLGSASCQAAIGYIRFMEQQYAMAKKNLQNALKYYDQIPHIFGKHYINRWLCSLKSKINRQENQLLSHRNQAQKLIKQAKISLKSNNISNTELIKHKLGVFVFRFTFDNISLFLEATFEIDVKPKIINEAIAKKITQVEVLSHNIKNQTGKFLEQIYYEDEDVINNNSKEAYKKPKK